jgi:callose synthase
MAGRPVQLTNNTRVSRRTALTNYFDYDDERLMIEQLESFPVGTQTTRNPVGIFELLQLKFGFQRASVANQKENFACWVANYQLRVDTAGGGDIYSALLRVHGKFLKNYIKWCKFLRTKPHLAPEGAPGHMLEKEIALFLCVWGEAANIRFMPECVCFLYHSLADKIVNLESLPDVAEGYYLQEIVRPVYDVVSRMRTAGSADPNKIVDHQDITNYDDLNEFFWTPTCLDYDALNVADALRVQDPKTFKEKRSIFNPVLAFFRVWFFLVLVFHMLVIITYVGYYTKDDGAQGWSYYANWFSASHKDLRNHAAFSIFLTVSLLFTFKVMLQVWLYGLRLFKDVWLTIGVLCRLIWHTFFFAIFLLVNISPKERFFVNVSMGKGSDGSAATYLSMGGYLGILYSIPVLLASMVRMFCAQGIWSIRFLNSLDGTRRQYIGRTMGQPWKWFALYGTSWIIIFFLKFLFALELMVRPLMGPTIQVYATGRSSANGVVESKHNLLFITALWVPVFVVYLYDTQIWFILYQTIVGLIVGLRQKMGHYATIETMKAALYTAPQQFDKSVASLRAQEQRVSAQADSAKAREESLLLRFGIIWNEIISSFRLNDLLDDRETVILQYRILDGGHKVENPIFLFAGMLDKAVELASKARANSWTTAELVDRLKKANVFDGMKDAAALASEVFHLLLGVKDDDGPIAVLEQIYYSVDIVSMLDMEHLPTLVENVVDLLSAILDMPDDLSAVDRDEAEFQEARIAFHDQTRLVVDKTSAVFRTLELMLGNDAVMIDKFKRCKFTKLSTSLTFQKKQLLSLYRADATAEANVLRSSSSIGSSHSSHSDDFATAASSNFSREDFVSSCTRLFFLLRLDVAHSYPRCQDARRRLSFFLHTLNMDMPKVPSVGAMPSFSVMTPYYSETVMFTLDELKDPVHSNPLFKRIDGKNKEKGRDDLTIMGYLITFHAEEWCNFLERMGVATVEEAVKYFPMQVRLWASLRGQTLARTVYGMMMYEDALRLLRWLELWNDAAMTEADKVSEMNHISALKFSYITGCQIYSQQIEKGDHRAQDIDYLMKRFPSWRVSFVDAVKDGTGNVCRYDCVLVKSEGDEIVEVYRYELPGNPILGEGKPENQNVALPFTRGEYLQTIDMNQEHYFEETLKMPNFLATAAASGEDVTIIGMKEHVFTGRASSISRFMTLQELVFVTLTQRVLAEPLRSRMHYGHPDVFEKSFVMTNGGVSKASKGINLSEDVFSGYNVTLRGGLVTHVEFMQCGKGRDVTLNQINAFEAKLSNGCAESCLSREGHRMSNSLDFFRLNSMYYGHFGFYICNALTVLCVYLYAYSKLYVATHNDVVETAATNTKELASLATVMGTQYILQFGMLTTLPLLATLIVEFGWKQAMFQVIELVSALGIVFYVFLTGTKAHYYDVALIRGGSKYRATGRGFAITRDPMVNFFKDYGVSHFRKAVELMGVMILYGVFGDFSIGVNAKADFCKNNADICENSPSLIPANITALDAYGSTPQSYGVASFAVLLLAACWLMAPFLFNTDGLVLEKTKIDVSNWFAWMMRIKSDGELIDADESSSDSTPKDSWLEWYTEDANLMCKVGPMGRLTYCFRELRHPLAMYFVFATNFSKGQWPILIASVFAAWGALWVGGFVANQTIRHNQKQVALTFRGIGYMVFALGSITFVPIIVGTVAGWPLLKSFTLSASIFIGLNAICQYSLAFHGAFGLPLAVWSPFIELGFLYDMLVGVFLVVPLVLLSFMPFMRILQTRMMFNGGFARALSTGSEIAASICILVGLTGGYVYGFMSCFILSLGYINEPKYHWVNRSFFYFVSNELSNKGTINMLTWIQNGRLKALCSLVAVLTIVLNYFLGKYFGRRTSMGVGAALITMGLCLNWVNDGVTLIVASCFISSGSVYLFLNYALYSFEICTKGWRGKGLSMFLIGSTIGFFVNAAVHNKLNEKTVSANFTNRPADNWRSLPMVAVLPVLLAFAVSLRFIPESPVWHRTREDATQCRAIYVRLRRRVDVSYDMNTLEKQMHEPKGTRNIPFRIALVCVLQAMLALLLSGGMLKRTVIRQGPDDTGADGSSWLMYFAGCTGGGLAFSVFLIDNVRRKTILKDFMPFLSLMCIICGSVDAGKGNGGIVEGFLFVIVIVTGLSFQSVALLTSLEVFGAANRALFFSLSLVVFHIVQGLVFFLAPSFAFCVLIFGGCCLGLTVLMFGVCASTKEKAIQLKTEKKKQQEDLANSQLDESRPSLVAATLQRRASMQQTRFAQVGQPTNAYFGQTQLSSAPSSTGDGAAGNVPYTQPTYYTHGSMSGSVVDLLAMQRTGLGNMSSIARGDSFNGAPLNIGQLQRQPTVNASSFYNRLSSIQSEDLDLEEEFDILFNNPEQPRSVSFLESRQFPDAEVHAETRGKGLRL